MIEQMIKDTTAKGKMSAVMLRYFNPVGAHKSRLIGESPRGIPNNLMPYILSVATGKLPELKIFGGEYPTRDGTGIRDYIHIIDLAKGHAGALDYCSGSTGVEIINLGTGRGCSVLELRDSFESVNGVKIPYIIAPRRAGDLPEVFADVSKAERLMGWKAGLTIEDMCRDAYAYAKMDARTRHSD
jgi:UDP-glucose 4-epimerase